MSYMKKNIFLSFLLCSILGYSQQTWEPIAAPHKGRITEIVYDNIDENCIYVSTADYPSLGGGLFKSIDGGNSWDMILECYDEGDLLLQTAPSNNQVLYTRNWKSADGGDSWSSTNISEVLPSNLKHYNPRFAVHPTNSNVIFACSSQDIMKSEDGGITWSNIYTTSDSDDWANRIVFDDISPNIIYALGVNKLYKSTDGGETWSEHELSLPGIWTCDLEIFQGVLYTGVILSSELWPYYSSDLLISSEDGGITWQELGLSSSEDDFRMINSFKVNEEGIFVATDKGIYKSVDNGSNWIIVSDDLDKYISIDIKNENIAIGSASHGISVFNQDLGVFINTGVIPVENASVGLYETQNGDVLYQGYNTVFKYNISGQYWSTICPSAYSTRYKIFYSKSEDIVYCLVDDFLYKSYNNGNSWDYICEFSNPITSNDFGSLNNGETLLFRSNNNILISENSGSTWSLEDIPGSSLAKISLSENGTIYIVDNTGSYYSQDNANTWVQLNGLPSGYINMSAFTVSKNNSDILYCMVLNSDYTFSIYKKSADTYQWSLKYKNEYTYDNILGNVCSNNNGNVLYSKGVPISESSYWLHRSFDDGVTWERCSNSFNFFYGFYETIGNNIWYIDSISNFWVANPELMNINIQMEFSGNMNFGDIEVGDSLTNILTISNIGDDYLQISDISTPDCFFTSSNSITLTPNATYDINVKFKPLSAQAYSGAIAFESNQTTGENSILVYGEGITTGNLDNSYYNNRVLIFPNPTKGFLTIESENVNYFTIYNLEGQEILRQKECSSSENVDLSKLNKGLYIIKFETDKGIKDAKIIIE